MSAVIENLIEAIDKLICLRVCQAEKGYHLPQGAIEDAQGDIRNAFQDLMLDREDG